MNIKNLIAFIEENVESPINIESLSTHAQCSESYFHREINKLTGLTPGKLVEILRIHRACYLLHYRKALRCTDIAILCGYNTADGLRRAFKRQTGFTPNTFRAQQVKIEQLPHAATLQSLLKLTTENATQGTNVQIIQQPAIPVYGIKHENSPAQIPSTVGQFIEWRKSHRLSPRVSRTFNVFWSDPNNADTHFRVDIMCEATRAVSLPQDERFFSGEIPPGRYAIIEVEGGDPMIQAATSELLYRYIPQHNEEMAEFPVLVERIRFYPDVPLNQALNRVMVLLK